MEISGKVIKILEPLSGVSAKSGEKWVKNSFVLEVGGQYPKRTVFTVFGEDKWQKMNIAVDGTYTVSFDIDAHEWNGRWYNEVSAWMAVRTDVKNGSPFPKTEVAKPPVEPKEVQESKEATEDNLPF